MLGYWLTDHGRNLPMPMKRGVADAVAPPLHGARRAALRRPRSPDPDGRRDRARAPVAARPGPVGAVRVPARPPAPRRRGRRPGGAADARGGGRARRGAGRRASRAACAERGAAALAAGGFSWERLSGWLPGGMDAEAWEAVIPSMGAMALVRNLRNFDRPASAHAAVDAVDRRRSPTPHEVAKARLFPYQVLGGVPARAVGHLEARARSHARPHGRRTSRRSTARSSSSTRRARCRRRSPTARGCSESRSRR